MHNFLIEKSFTIAHYILYNNKRQKIIFLSWDKEHLLKHFLNNIIRLPKVSFATGRYNNFLQDDDLNYYVCYFPLLAP